MTDEITLRGRVLAADRRLEGKDPAAPATRSKRSSSGKTRRPAGIPPAISRAWKDVLVESEDDVLPSPLSLEKRGIVPARRPRSCPNLRR
jgi:hypothetical protein